jgi:hypothetical protein
MNKKHKPDTAETPLGVAAALPLRLLAMIAEFIPTGKEMTQVLGCVCTSWRKMSKSTSERLWHQRLKREFAGQNLYYMNAALGIFCWADSYKYESRIDRNWRNLVYQQSRVPLPIRRVMWTAHTEEYLAVTGFQEVDGQLMNQLLVYDISSSQAKPKQVHVCSVNSAHWSAMTMAGNQIYFGKINGGVYAFSPFCKDDSRASCLVEPSDAGRVVQLAACDFPGSDDQLVVLWDRSFPLPRHSLGFVTKGPCQPSAYFSAYRGGIGPDTLQVDWKRRTVYMLTTNGSRTLVTAFRFSPENQPQLTHMCSGFTEGGIAHLRLDTSCNNLYFCQAQVTIRYDLHRDDFGGEDEKKHASAHHVWMKPLHADWEHVVLPRGTISVQFNTKQPTRDRTGLPCLVELPSSELLGHLNGFPKRPIHVQLSDWVFFTRTKCIVHTSVEDPVLICYSFATPALPASPSTV